jgi:hypothetical protein
MTYIQVKRSGMLIPVRDMSTRARPIARKRKAEPGFFAYLLVTILGLSASILTSGAAFCLARLYLHLPIHW